MIINLLNSIEGEKINNLKCFSDYVVTLDHNFNKYKCILLITTVNLYLL